MKDAKARWTRNDFERIADVLRETRPEVPSSRIVPGHEYERGSVEGRFAEWQILVHHFAGACYDYSNLTPNGNRAFDGVKFMKWVMA